MAVIGKPFSAGSQIANSNTTYYTAGSGIRSRVEKATICNTDSSARTFSLYLVPTGGSAGVTNQLIDTRSVNVDETITISELIGQWLAPGDFIVAVASAASALTLRISGVEVSG